MKLERPDRLEAYPTSDPLNSGDRAARNDASPKPPAVRVAGLATNVLATGLILILGAVGARHALHWWSAARMMGTADPVAEVIGPDAVPRRPVNDRGAKILAPIEHSADEPLRHLLAFGDGALAATRTELHGDTQAALARLRADCRSIAKQTTRVQRTSGPAERQMLSNMHRREPVEATSRWRMYQIDSPVPMVVTVLDQPVRDASNESPQVAGLESRVVSWGLAFPAVSDQDAPLDRWTLFTLTADPPRLGLLAAHSTLPIPPQSRRTMSLQADSGAAIVGVRGTGSIHTWRKFYDDLLVEPAWTPTSGWRHEGHTWQRSFTNSRGGRLDVQLLEAADGLLTGLLMSAPPIMRAARLPPSHGE